MQVLLEVLEAQIFLDDFHKPKAQSFCDGAVVVEGIIEESMGIGLLVVILAVVQGQLMGNTIFNNVEEIKQGVDVCSHAEIHGD